MRAKEGDKQDKVSKLAKAEVLMLNIGSMCTGARVLAVKHDLAKIQLTSPVCTKEGEKVALSRWVLAQPAGADSDGVALGASAVVCIDTSVGWLQVVVMMDDGLLLGRGVRSSVCRADCRGQGPGLAGRNCTCLPQQ